jgi:hypothetical protein
MKNEVEWFWKKSALTPTILDLFGVLQFLPVNGGTIPRRASK